MLNRGVGAGVLIRRRHRIVDEIRPLAHQPLGFLFRLLAIQPMGDQRVLPAPVEFGVIDHLEPFHARPRGVGPRAHPLKVHDFRGRLHHHPLAQSADAEGQVGVLVIGRCVIFIEATQLLEQRPLDHQRGTGNPVGVTQK